MLEETTVEQAMVEQSIDEQVSVEQTGGVDELALRKADKRRRTLVRISRLGVFVALALIMYFLEAMLPPLLPFAPGAKLGLTNVVVLIAIFTLGYLDAFLVQIIRIFLGTLFSNFSQILFAAPAGIVSVCVMMLLFRFCSKHISVMAISFCGAVMHNLVQCIVASMLNQNASFLMLLPVQLIASFGAGLFVGSVAYFLVKKLPTSVYVGYSV